MRGRKSQFATILTLLFPFLVYLNKHCVRMSVDVDAHVCVSPSACMRVSDDVDI